MSAEKKPKTEFQEPILFVEGRKEVMPLPEPLPKSRTQILYNRDDLTAPWLLTSAEEAERDALLDKLRSGISLTERDRERLKYLCSKRVLGENSNAQLILSSDRIPFTPRE